MAEQSPTSQRPPLWDRIREVADQLGKWLDDLVGDAQPVPVPVPVPVRRRR